MHAPSETPVVSVIIPTWNHSYLLKDFLRSFEANIGPDWLARTELIIVDNGSTDDTETVLQQWTATANPQFGQPLAIVPRFGSRSLQFSARFSF